MDNRDFKFKHRYCKLEHAIFPTLRGKNSLEKYTTGKTYAIRSPVANFAGILADKYHIILDDISPSFFVLDSAHRTANGIISAKNIDEYIELINSFIKGFTSFRYQSTSIVTIFWIANGEWFRKL